MPTEAVAIVSPESKSFVAEDMLEKPVQKTGLAMLQQGCFSCQTMTEAIDLAHFLSHCYPKPREALVGISELLQNAIEHGNLGLDYEDKKKLIEAGDYQAEIDRRARDVSFSNRRVQVMFDRIENEIRLTIADEGKGFNWREYLEVSPDRIEDPNGRGIKIAREISFDKMEYNNAGNMVMASVFA